jgi:hypothetical protein
MVKASEGARSILARARRVPYVPILLCLALAAILSESVFVLQATTQVGCSLCHTSAQAHRRLEVKPHRGQPCSACHSGSGRFNLLDLNARAAHNLLVELTPWAKPDPSRGFVENEACLRCHAHDVASTTAGRQGRVKMKHKEPLQSGMACRDCHGDVSHTNSATVPSLSHSSCTGCHDGKTAGIACTECHVGQPERATANLPGAEKTIHLTRRTQLHGMGDLATCVICHSRASCRDCHRVDLPHDMNTFPQLHGRQALKAPGACTDRCHRQEFCDSCHGLPMPHESGFLRQHQQATKRYGEPACLRCHVQADCESCHKAHRHPKVPGLSSVAPTTPAPKQ